MPQTNPPWPAERLTEPIHPAPVSYARLSACIEKVDYLEGLVEEYRQKIAFLEEEVAKLRGLLRTRDADL